MHLDLHDIGSRRFAVRHFDFKAQGGRFARIGSRECRLNRVRVAEFDGRAADLPPGVGQAVAIGVGAAGGGQRDDVAFIGDLIGASVGKWGGVVSVNVNAERSRALRPVLAIGCGELKGDVPGKAIRRFVHKAAVRNSRRVDFRASLHNLAVKRQNPMRGQRVNAVHRHVRVNVRRIELEHDRRVDCRRSGAGFGGRRVVLGIHMDQHSIDAGVFAVADAQFECDIGLPGSFRGGECRVCGVWIVERHGRPAGLRPFVGQVRTVRIVPGSTEADHLTLVDGDFIGRRVRRVRP